LALITFVELLWSSVIQPSAAVQVLFIKLYIKYRIRGEYDFLSEKEQILNADLATIRTSF